MSLALGQKRSPDNIRKQERDIMHGASKHSQAIYHAFPVSVIQRKPSCPCGGGCPRCKNTLTIQPKLKINEPGDTHEQEADRVAEQVMRMPANTSASGQLSGVRKEDKHIQNRIADLVMATTAQTVVSGASSRIQRFVRQSTGQTDASARQCKPSPCQPWQAAGADAAAGHGAALRL